MLIVSAHASSRAANYRKISIFIILHSAFIIKKRGTLSSSDDYESRNQMVPASLLAAGVFDKPFLLEFKEAAIHGGLRIGGVENEFRGAATGMLFDVVEERDNNGGGYTDKLFVSKMLFQVFDSTIAGVFDALNRVDFRFIPIFLTVKNLVYGDVLTVVFVIANVKHSGKLIDNLSLRFQGLLQLFPFSQHVSKKVESEVAAEDEQQTFREKVE